MDSKSNNILNKKIEALRVKHDSFVAAHPADYSKTPAQVDFLPTSEAVLFNERNVEKWAFFLFPHSRTKGIKERRTLTVGEQRIVIKPTAGDKAYTNRTYKTFLAILQMWFEAPASSGWSDGWVEGYLGDVCRHKRITPKSGKNLESVLTDIECLHDTVIDWVRSFDVNGTPTSLEKVRFFTHFKYEKGAYRDGKSFERKFKVQINSSIIQSIRVNHVNPVPQAVFDIRGEVSCIYFCLVDTKIALKKDGKPWEWSSLSSFSEMNLLEIKKYKYLGDRKVVLDRIVKDIDGKKLTSGEVLRVKVLKTKDSKDWKIRHWKEASKYSPKLKTGLPVLTKDRDEVTYLAGEIAAVVGQEDTHMPYYKKLCRHYPQNVIFRALGNYKEAKSMSEKTVKDNGKFFSYTIHLIAHDMGHEWVGSDCDEKCPLRKENQLPLG